MEFKGFSERTVDFLWGIRLNNDRAWYNEHKDECKKYLTEPMNALAQYVLAEMDRERPDLQLGVHISRIYRDARRLYGKGPYKDHMWFSVYDMRRDKDEGKPSFWFELGPERWSYGLGVYDCGSLLMKRLRKRIESEPATVIEINRLMSERGEFVLAGDEYKKKYNDCPVIELASWYRKKNIEFIHKETVGPAITDPELKTRVARGLVSLLPIYDIIEPLTLTEQKE